MMHQGEFIINSTRIWRGMQSKNFVPISHNFLWHTYGCQCDYPERFQHRQQFHLLYNYILQQCYIRSVLFSPVHGLNYLPKQIQTYLRKVHKSFAVSVLEMCCLVNINGHFCIINEERHTQWVALHYENTQMLQQEILQEIITGIVSVHGNNMN